MVYMYVVQKGDTLYRLARRHSVNVEAMLVANPVLSVSNPLVPGQLIHIPERPVNQYIVQVGDSLSFLSKRFNIDVDDLLEANPDVDWRWLKIGQSLVLPRSRGASVVRSDLPYGFSELETDLIQLTRKYPFLELRSIGKSVLEKPLFALRIGSGPVSMHANAAIHANEWITTPVLLKFVEEYSEALSTGGKLRGHSAEILAQRTSLWIVPMVNPDGVELVLESVTPQHPFFEKLLTWNAGSFEFRRWKANANGVDLNDQFPAHWDDERKRRQVNEPGPRDYSGERALSEPEALALATFTSDNDFRLVVSLHTQGQELYWNYRDLEPEESELLATRLARASGVNAVKLTSSDAGYKDWFIQQFRRPGFTLELGFGVNPLPLEQFPDCYNSAASLLVECLNYCATDEASNSDIVTN